MYRSQERVVTAEPLVHDIDGLLKNPAYNATHTAAVLGQLLKMLSQRRLFLQKLQI